MFYLTCCALQEALHRNIAHGAYKDDAVSPEFNEVVSPVSMAAIRQGRIACLLSPETELCSPYLDGRADGGYLSRLYRSAWLDEERWNNEAVNALVRAKKEGR